MENSDDHLDQILPQSSSRDLLRNAVELQTLHNDPTDDDYYEDEDISPDHNDITDQQEAEELNLSEEPLKVSTQPLKNDSSNRQSLLQVISPVISPLFYNQILLRSFQIISLLYPFILFSVILIRYDIVSFIYLLGYFSLNLVGHRGSNLLQIVKILNIYSAIILLSKSIYHICLASISPGYQDNYIDPTFPGLTGFYKIFYVSDALLQFLPEFIILISGFVLVYLNSKISLIGQDGSIDGIQSVPQERRRINMYGKVYSFLILFMFISLFLYTFSIPSALNVLYVIYMSSELLSWAYPKSLKSMMVVFRSVFFYYFILHSATVYLFQIDVINSQVSRDVQLVLGLDNFKNDLSTTSSYFFMICLIVLNVLFHFQQKVGNLLESVSITYPMGQDLKLSRIWKINFTSSVMSETIIEKFGQFVVSNNSKLISLCLFILAVSFPSFLSLPILISGSLLLVIPSIFTQLYPILVYVHAFILIQFIFNIRNSNFQEFKDIGLVYLYPSSIMLGLQFFVSFFIAVFCYNWNLADDRLGSSSVNVSYNETFATQSNFGDNQKSKTQKIKDFLSVIWFLISAFAFKYAYLISLIVLYFCGLQKVNVINSGFMIFFIAFLLYPLLAQRLWIVLVIYTELIIILEFFWQFSFATSNKVTEIWGLEKTDNLWSLLSYHLVILVFTALQLDVYKSLEAEQRYNTVDQETADQGEVTKQQDSEVQNGKIQAALNKFYLIIKYYLNAFNLIFCCLTFILITCLNQVTIFSIGYLLIFLIISNFYVFKIQNITKKVWLAIASYPAALALCCYLYQFKSLQIYLQDKFGEQVLLDIGLVPTSGNKLFEYLIQHVAALFLCVLQYRIYSGSLKAPENLSDLGVKVPEFMLSFAIFVKRALIVHVNKIIFILTFYLALQNISVFGLATLLYLVFLVPFTHAFGPTLKLLLSWISLYTILLLLFQLEMIQSSNLINQNMSWFGLYKFQEFQLPIQEITLSILIIVIFNLKRLSSLWKNQMFLEDTSLPQKVQDWPLLQVRSRQSQPHVTSQSSLSRLVKIASNSLQELLVGLNYWFSNFYNHFSFEIITFVHLICGFAKGNVIGLFYLIFCGIVYTIRFKVKQGFALYLGFVSTLIIFQYLCVLGYPPSTGIQFPWYSLSEKVLRAIGIPLSSGYLYISPDFFILLLSSFQLARFVVQQENQYDYAPWLQYRKLLDLDYTIKPRSKNSQIKMVFIRYFLWVVVLFLFASGTVKVDLPRFVFLCFSLFLIAVGENFTLKSESRRKTWNIIFWYSFIWVILQVIFQLVANFVGVFDQSSLQWYQVFGFNTTSVTDRSSQVTLSFTPENTLTIFMVLTVIIQRRINDSTSLSHLIKFIRKDSSKSQQRAYEYYQQQRSKVRERRRQQDEEVKLIRNEVSSMKGSTQEVQEWIQLIGRDDIDDDNWIIVEKGQNPDQLLLKQENIQFQTSKVNFQNDDTLIQQSQVKEEESHQKTENLESRAKYSEESGVQRVDLADSELEESIKKQDEKPLSLPRKLALKLLGFIYKLSIDYTEIYVMNSTKSLIDQEFKDESLLWCFIRGIFFAICAHTTLLVYLAVFANQIYHSDILSIIPTFSVLLVAMVQRPFPSKRFWNFLIASIEITILAKYFFQFQVFTFNQISCNQPKSYLKQFVYIFGIQKTCGTFFVDVLTELTILLCCIVHRGLMRRLGLWNLDKKKVRSQSQEKLSQSFEQPHESTDGLTRRQSSPQTLLRNVKDFYQKTVDKKHLPGSDFYLGIIVSEMFIFILTILFWPSFSGNSSIDDNIQFITTVFSQNTVPPLFVAILVLNFVLIIIDRAIYIAKALKAKYIMQYLTVVSFSTWLFFILPISNNQPFNEIQSLQFWFFVKCIYWYFSGQQIKNGYPDLRVNNFLMRKQGRFNLIAFNIYRILPFMWEIRNFIDWSLSDSVLNLYEWLKFEEIYASLYVVKTNRVLQKYDPHKFGRRRLRTPKKICGSLIILALTFLLWFPLIYLSIPGSTKPNPALGVQMQVSIVGFEPFYTQQVPNLLIRNLTQDDLQQLRSQYSNLFPSYYNYVSLQYVTLPNNSLSNWQINPPSERSLRASLSNFNQSVQLQVTVTLDKGEGSGYTQSSGVFYKFLSSEERLNFLVALNQSNPQNNSIKLTSVIPQFLHSRSSGSIINLSLQNQYLNDIELEYIQFNRNQTTNSTEQFNSSQRFTDNWWQLYYTQPFTNLKSQPFIYILSDNIPTISSISSNGIIGLYVAIVFTVGRVLRGAISGLSQRIMYEDLPYPDRLLKICEDIILAREMRDFIVEESLYYKLITLFRSPNLLIEATKMPE